MRHLFQYFTIITLLCTSIHIVRGQQLPLFTQYSEYKQLINPAALNNDYFRRDYKNHVSGSYRYQWTSVPGGPKTQVLKYDRVLDGYDGINWSVGGHLINDQTGPTGFSGAFLRLNAILTPDIKEEGLGIGLTVGAVQYRVNVNELEFLDPELLEYDNERKLAPDVGLGVFYYKNTGGGANRDNMFYAGLSVPQLLGWNLFFDKYSEKFSIKRVPHFYGVLGYNHDVTEEFYIEPTVWLRYVYQSIFSADFNIRCYFKDNFWIGGGISTAANFHLDVGVLIGPNIGYESVFKIGYAFDRAWTTYGPFFGYAHELNLSYSF